MLPQSGVPCQRAGGTRQHRGAVPLEAVHEARHYCLHMVRLRLAAAQAIVRVWPMYLDLPSRHQHIHEDTDILQLLERPHQRDDLLNLPAPEHPLRAILELLLQLAGR